MTLPLENATEPALSARDKPGLKHIIRALRPSQWTKNIILLVTAFFAFWDRSGGQHMDAGSFTYVIFAAFLFCIISSGIYILNDIKDFAADRTHPEKRNRPIAAGIIPIPLAWGMSVILLSTGLTCSLFLPPLFTLVVSSYVLIQIVYSYGLKKVAMVDVIVIAGGFVLRAIAGAAAIPNVTISPWLLLCTFLLALFLALCKRRHEKFFLDSAHRQSLEKYSRRLLDQLIAVTSAATIVAYSIYTFWPDTYQKFGTHSLGFTIPFVIFGIFRYLDLVYRHGKGDRPEMVLLTDVPLLANLFLYGLVITAVFLRLL